MTNNLPPLHYEVKGNGEPVLLLHGYLENSHMWEDVVQELTKTNRVISADLPGHGKSPNYAPIHTMPLMAEKINELLEKEGITKVNIIGHSMGGYVALALAKAHPEKINSLCLFYSTPLADDEVKKEQRLRAVELARENRESYIQHSIPLLFNPHQRSTLSPEIKQALQWANTTPKGIEAALLGMREREDLSAVLKATYPVLIVSGKHDPAISLQSINALKQQYPTPTYISTDAGHMGHLEDRENSVKILIEWIKKA